MLRIDYFYLLIYLLAIRKSTIYKLMWWLYKVRYDTMYYYDLVRYSSSYVTWGAKSKGQHRFSLLVFIGCSRGSNSGLGWASSLMWCLLILSWMTSH